MPPEPSVTSACEGPRSCTLRYSSALLPKSFERPGPKSVSPATYCSGVEVVVPCRWIVDMRAPFCFPPSFDDALVRYCLADYWGEILGPVHPLAGRRRFFPYEKVDHKGKFCGSMEIGTISLLPIYIQRPIPAPFGVELGIPFASMDIFESTISHHCNQRLLVVCIPMLPTLAEEIIHAMHRRSAGRRMVSLPGSRPLLAICIVPQYQPRIRDSDVETPGWNQHPLAFPQESLALFALKMLEEVL